jgi:Flp pilus assembly protein CpaB
MLMLALFSLTLSAMIALLAYRFLQTQISSEMASVVITTQKLPLGTRLAPEHLQAVSWPKSSLLKNSFSDPKSWWDRVVVPLSPGSRCWRQARSEGGGAGLTSVPEA